MSTPELNVIVATDCGSTTTKAILIEKKPEGYRQTFRGEAPTTVEAPFEDVTRGVLNAFAELEELSGRRILDGERILTPARGNEGVDIYVSTSSAGGGLQMMVAGVVKQMTAESAQRAALGAGAIVMDVLAANDQRLPHEKIELIRRLRPDMVLLSGGTDGGTITHVVELAEFLAAANPRPRLGRDYKLPVIYAGNKDAREAVAQRLAAKTELHPTENLRPVLERENLAPARNEIHELFLKHVMAQAPGYDKLMAWVGAPIMPTPAAVGAIMQTIARRQGINLIGVDIGGATTDVFSVYGDVFNRTVSANLGMSYSISNVLAEAGLANILRWVPFDIDETDLRDRIKNKMIRPTTIPQLLEELKIEQAIAREALRLAFEQHKALAVGLKGVQRERTISESFDETAAGATLINLRDLDLLVGSGGVLSHAPRRHQAAMMLVDAFQPEGVTRLAVDSIFMMPHLGVLAQVHEQAAEQVFVRDCLINLGTCVAMVNQGKPGTPAFDYTLAVNGQTRGGSLAVGDIKLEPLGVGETAQLAANPARGVDLGQGRGKALEATVHGGVVGVILDARGRPLVVPERNRAEIVNGWAKALNAYPA
ncbi:MAG TPA: glutamate mutase L [Planctomycetota bacterium]|mgnify:FL=1|nr:glutamate mutase L [Planctomycetota bacterium]HRR79859.1 glutamate mutase L [Planctomycetota bacterium]HRT92935.1 glutamate mutase L [Planctomycetota bacterium]